MKHSVHILLLIASITSVIASEEETGFFTHPRYTREELVATRLLLLKQEKFLPLLKEDAAKKSHVSRYAPDSQVHSNSTVAFDDNNQTVSSEISPYKWVTLTYVDYDLLLGNKPMQHLAEKTKQLELETAISTTAGIAGLHVFKKLAEAIAIKAPTTEFQYKYPLLRVRHCHTLEPADNHLLLQRNDHYKLVIDSCQDHVTTVMRFEPINEKNGSE